MSNDTELFDLCREVYKKTKWGQYGDEGLDYYPQPKAYPKYTSDYLLEKLPLIIEQRDTSPSDYFFELSPGFAGDTKWLAKYQDINEGQLVAEYGATAVEALLKLTLALNEVGELK